MGKKDKKVDRRTQYTKDIIKKSLLNLMKEKDFSKITVAELCRLAEINRGTFYIHYLDLKDVLDELADEIIAKTTGVFQQIAVFSDNDANTIKGCTYPLCEIIQGNPEYNVLFFNDSLGNYMKDKLIKGSMADYADEIMSRSNLSREQAEALVVFQLSGCLAMNQYIHKNRINNFCEIQKVVDNLLQSGFEKILD